MDSSQKLGQKLLQGWTMLNESCGACNAPLMRSRDGLQVVCVVCPEKPVEHRLTPVPASSVQSESISEPEIVLKILQVLNSSLNTDENAQPDQSFLSILEAALLALKAVVRPSLQLGNQPDLTEIRNKIRTRAMRELSKFNTSCTEIIINRFKFSASLLKCLNELAE